MSFYSNSFNCTNNSRTKHFSRLGIVQTTADRSQGSLYIDIDLQHLSLFVCQDGQETHMLLNPKALLEEDGSVDHDIDVVLGLCQRVVVVIHIQLHCLAQSLDDNN